MRKINLIVVHCSATRATQDIGAAEIDVWHKARGFSGIGYHYVIRRDGEMERGRPDDQVGAHAKGYNANSLGVCLVGGIDVKGKPESNFTDAQFRSLEDLLSTFAERYPLTDVLGHRDLPWVSKSCPCFDVRAWMKSRAAKAMPEAQQV